MQKFGWTTAFTGAMALASLAGCGAERTNPAASKDAADIATIIGGVDAGVKGLGSGLGDAAAVQLKGLRTMDTASTHCTQHAEPTDGTGTADGNKLPQSDAEFALRGFYCRLVKDTGSPDSIPGSYTLVKNIACALKNAGGLTFDGTKRSVTMTIDTACFTAEQVADMGASSMVIDVTAASPAADNAHYSHGVKLEIPDFGTFQLMTKVTGSLLEFATIEDQGNDKTGTFFASFDESTGELRYEGRSDRFDCSGDGSCGWSRHDRFYAKVGLNADGSLNADGVRDVSGIHSEAYANPVGGWVATIKGDVTSGLKPLLWTKSTSGIDTATGWTSTAQAACSSTGGCSGNDGIAMPTSGSLPFTLVTGHSSSAAVFSGLTSGLTFTAASFADLPN